MDGTQSEEFWRVRAEQLQHALSSRVVVEQAKGVLAERLALDLEGAFEVIRYAARSTQTKLHDLAREVLESEETPKSIVEAVARHGALLRRTPPSERVLQTERFFRAVNDEINRLNGETIDYVCECGNPHCAKAIVLNAEVLLRLHAEPNLFVVLPGHEISGVETVVEEGTGYLIVRKDD